LKLEAPNDGLIKESLLEKEGVYSTNTDVAITLWGGY